MKLSELKNIIAEEIKLLEESDIKSSMEDALKFKKAKLLSHGKIINVGELVKIDDDIYSIKSSERNSTFNISSIKMIKVASDNTKYSMLYLKSKKKYENIRIKTYDQGRTFK